MAGCADQVKRVTLELGGKSANIVFADADLETRGRHRAVRRVRERRPGLLRAQPHPRRAQRATTGSWSCSSRRSPASWSATRPTRPPRWARSWPASTSSACARSCPTTRMSRSAAPRPTGPGFWFAPTVLHAARATACGTRGDLRPGRLGASRSTTRPTRSRFANASEYGLSGSIWTRDLGRGIRVARGVESGNLCVNSHSSVRYATPFGGFKQSGLGRELGPDAPLAFTETKNVFISTRRLTDDRIDHDRSTMTDLPRIDLTQRLAGRVAVITGGASRHRPRHREAPRRRGREGRDRRPRRRAPARRPPTLVDGLFVPGRRHRRGAGGPPLRHRGRRPTAPSTSPSTTRASRRPTTTRSRRPSCRPGRRCRTST